MTDHTPTPWKVGHGPNNEIEVWGRMRMNASPILMSLGIMEHDPREANAAFIVKAVNAHEALVKALKDILDANYDFRNGMPDDWEGDPLQDACSNATELLAGLVGDAHD